MSRKRTEVEDSEEYPGIGGTPRWVAMSVMAAAVAGFVGLAWYAYHAGTRSVQEEELLLVEADKSPVKEKPEDPGGMKFPHQDKAIFDVVANSPAKPDVVERVLPAPEEPAPQAEAKNWLNDKLEKPAPSAVDAKLAQAAASIAPSAGDAAEAKPEDSAPVTVTVQEVQPDAVPATKQAADKVELKQTAPAPAQKPEAPKAKPAKPAAKAKNEAGGGMAQLGSYRSEEEAKKAWAALQARHADLKSLSPDIQRADLGAKGIYYRLRVSGGKAVCAKIQPCMAVK